MFKIIRKYIIIISLVNCFVYSQVNSVISVNKNVDVSKVSLVSRINKSLDINNSTASNSRKGDIKSNLESYIAPKRKPENKSADFFSIISEFKSIPVVSSFINNFQFRSWRNGYMDINFTPNIHLKPFNNVSLNIYHNMGLYLPAKYVREKTAYFLAEGLGVMLIDNSVDYLLPLSNTVNSILSFAAKNLFITFANKTITKVFPEIQHIGEFRYSVNIAL